MKKMLLLFSHELTLKQIEDAKDTWHVENFIYLPDDLQKVWSNISEDLESLKDILDPIKTFVKENSAKGDLVLVQGDTGACYMLVDFSKKLDLVSVYATTKRIVSETMENEKLVKKSIFEHGRFREYE